MNGIIQRAIGRKILMWTEMVTSRLAVISVITRNILSLDSRMKTTDSFHHVKGLMNVGRSQKWNVWDQRVQKENILDNQVLKWGDLDNHHMVVAHRACHLC